jgi:hypothetical protein
MNRDFLRIAAVPVFVLMAACGTDDAVEDDTFGMDTTMTMPPPAAAPMETAGMGTTVALASVGGSGVSGEATLTESGQQTEVMVRLVGSQPNATHQGHIHQGTCDNVGSVVVALDPITVDAQGSGTSTTMVDVAIHDAANGEHLVAYHEAGGTPGAPAACGEIPAHMM